MSTNIRRKVIEHLQEKQTISAYSAAKELGCSHGVVTQMMKALREAYGDRVITVTKLGMKYVYNLKENSPPTDTLLEEVDQYFLAKKERTSQTQKRKITFKKKIPAGAQRLIKDMPAEIDVESASFTVRLGDYKIRCVISNGVLDACLTL